MKHFLRIIKNANPLCLQVMKDWSDLEERYQDIRARDPKAADGFKRWMTTRFQQTVAALEASGAAEKHHLSAMHQQRVQVCFFFLIQKVLLPFY